MYLFTLLSLIIYLEPPMKVKSSQLLSSVKKIEDLDFECFSIFWGFYKNISDLSEKLNKFK